MLPPQLLGKLGGVLYIGSGLVSIVTLPLPQPPEANLLAQLFITIAVLPIGVFAWYAPWHRWGRAATLWLVPPSLVLIAAGNVASGYEARTYGVFFVLVFVWIGLGHPRWTSAWLALPAAAAYIAPLLVKPGSGATDLASTALVIPICALVGESLAWVVARYTRTQEALLRAEEERRRLLSRLVSAQEEERRRIAEDIHDDPIQVMTVAGMRLQMLRRQLSGSKQVEALQRLELIIERAVERLRHLMFELRPYALDRDGLGAALRLYLDEKAKEAKRPAFCLVDRLTAEPPANTRVILYRVAQELLTNAKKHAGASRVELVLEQREGAFVLRVTDDGIGFSPGDLAAPRPGHLGLATIREHAEMAGGRCQIDSGPGRGTTVEIEVPA
jgi:signal transduction histidine kinase